MPVSPWPILFPALLVSVPFFFLMKGQRHFLYASATSAGILITVFLWVFVPGVFWRIRAATGDRIAMYELARWTECHQEQIGAFVLWPEAPDVLGGYAWLGKSADLDYPPALFALGVRLKYGYGVPEPPNWDGPGGNWFPQPARGQPLIDRAYQLGYIPPAVGEKYFYGSVYRY